MTGYKMTCRFQGRESEAKCLRAATYIVCEPLTGYAFLVCGKHYPGLERMLEERTGCLTWTVQQIDERVRKTISGEPPLSNRGVTKTKEA